MSLTLIQEQVLESLAELCEDITARTLGVAPFKVREQLATRRPARVSEQYVRRVLRDLCDQRIDGFAPVRTTRRKRAVCYVATTVGRAYVARRRQAQA